MNAQGKLEAQIKKLISTCEKWLKITGDGIKLIDPIENKEIPAHYGATHLAASFIIRGRKEEDDTLYQQGLGLVNNVLNSWLDDTVLPDFHFDFNNFALCVLLGFLKPEETTLTARIKNVLVETPDSNHFTINWLPMRIFVNQKRFEWTNEQRFKHRINLCNSQITSATNNDGGVEDRLPRGVSYNLQYNVATIASLQFLRCRSVDYELSTEFGFLLDKVLPDGDINYQGRGTNQIFAWGMWLYLLASSGRCQDLDKALYFLENKIEEPFENNNILLNEWCGEDRFLWWDYHYCSVYTAHYLFWLVLSVEDLNLKPIQPSLSSSQSTGLKKESNLSASVVTFSGRNNYLSERGPAICALHMTQYGSVVKASFGPWLGAFGNRNLLEFPVLLNYFGLIQAQTERNLEKNKWVNRISKMFHFNTKTKLKISPYFAEPDIALNNDSVSITFINGPKKRLILNLPVLDSISKNPELHLLADGKPLKLTCNVKIRNQYGWCNVYQSAASNASEWRLVLK